MSTKLLARPELTAPRGPSRTLPLTPDLVGQGCPGRADGDRPLPTRQGDPHQDVTGPGYQRPKPPPLAAQDQHERPPEIRGPRDLRSLTVRRLCHCSDDPAPLSLQTLQRLTKVSHPGHRQ